MTNGAFDPTFASMDGLWNFENSAKEHTVPSKDQVEARKVHVNYKNVILDNENTSIFLKDAEMRLSLGGIARGYAIDNSKKILQSHGLKNFSVRSKSELYTHGHLTEHLLIPHPDNKNVFASFDLQDRAYQY